MTCSRSHACALFLAALLTATVCGALAVKAASAAAPPIYLPLVQPNTPPAPVLGPPVAVYVRTDFATVTAGQPVTLTAMLLDAAGNALPPTPDLVVFLSAGGRDLLADRMETTAGPAGYSVRWLPPAAGVYTVGAVAAQAADGAKAGLPVAPFTLSVTPGPVVRLDLAAHTFASIALPDSLAATPYDAAGNALLDPPAADVVCTSDIPAVQAGAAQPLPTEFYADTYGVPLDGSRQLGIPLTATDYGVATIACTHTPSGATATATVASAPWELRWRELAGEPGVAFVPGNQFMTSVSARAPSGAAWTKLQMEMEWPTNPQLSESNWGSLLPEENLSSQYTDVDGVIWCAVTLNTSSANTGTLPALRSWWQVSPFMPPNFPPAPLGFKVTRFTLSSSAGAIPYDPAPFDPWRTITLTIMPTQSLPAHVYVVAGAADPGDVEADLARAQRALTVNRGACLPAFDLQVEVTEVPAAAWAALDADGDGFDRWDANGDGEFSGAADSDDLAAAAAAGYADAAPGTINVYYVPRVRGAPALAATGDALALAGTQHDSAQYDGWALFHLLMHALDLRADSDRDLAHVPGAPGNALNVDLPGPFLTPEQCAALNP